MSNDAQATSTRRPGRPKAGSEDKKARILAEALTLFSTRGLCGNLPGGHRAGLGYFEGGAGCTTYFVEGPAGWPLSWTSVIVAR